MTDKCPTCDGRGTMPKPYGDHRDNGRTYWACPNCQPEKVPSAEEVAQDIYDEIDIDWDEYEEARVITYVAATIEADRERIREATLQPFRDLIEWDSVENICDDTESKADMYVNRWIGLGNRLRALVPPKEAPDA